MYFRHALRTLARQKILTLVALLTLALGIGANTAIFSVVNGVLLSPLPYPEPDEIVRVSEEHPGANAPISGMLSDITMLAWTPSLTTLESVAPFGAGRVTVGMENPERLDAARFAPSLFSMLRVQPRIGRFFTDDEAVEGADDVVVLGQGFWQERFGGDPGALGARLVIDERPRTIVGVAPEGFAFPGPETALWTPYVLPTARDPEDGSMSVFGAIARLAPGVTPEQAAAEGTAAARSVERPFAADMLLGEGGPVEVRVRRLVDEMTADVRPALHVLWVGVGLVLLIACANVANLLLSHGMSRQRELAVRSALGASRGRIVRHLLTESLMVSVAGGIAGWLLAAGLIDLLPALAPGDFPRLDNVGLDGRVLAFAIVASLLAGVASGMIPALRGALAGDAAAMHDGGTRATRGGGKRLRAGMLVAEAALAVVLVVGASLLLRSFVTLARVDSGYDPTNVLLAQVHFPGADREAGRTGQVVDTLLRRLEGRPDVVAAAASNMAPFGGATAISGFSLPSTEADAEPRTVRANSWTVTPGFADALGLRVPDGRFLSPDDVDSGTQAMVVNEEFVRLFLNDGQPVVGRTYENLIGDADIVTEIVGVVGNVLKDGPGRPPQPEIYLAGGANGRALGRWVFLFVRTVGEPSALAPELRDLLRQEAPRAALDGVGTLDARLSSAMAQPRFATAVLGSFAVLALLLAASGLYGAMSYSVAQRRREIGVRAALGADRATLIRMVLRQGLAVAVPGLVLGLAAAAAVTRLMESMLFGVQPLDWVAFGAAPPVLLAVAVAACVLPARRAARVDPAVAFRAE